MCLGGFENAEPGDKVSGLFLENGAPGDIVDLLLISPAKTDEQ